MSTTRKFGIITLQQLPWNETIKVWKKIESLGFDSVWIADHFVNYNDPTGDWFDCWSLLAGLSGFTKTIRIGSLVSPLPLHHPAQLVRKATTVDHISNGRLEIGIGTGIPGDKGELVYDMINMEDWSPPERVARFEEAIQIIDRCLRQPITSFDGKYYKIQNNPTSPLPIQKPRPPITVGAMGKSMMRLAIRYADTWSSYGGPWGLGPDEMFEATKNRVEFVESYCKQINRDPTTLKKSILVYGSDAQRIFASEENFKEIITKYSSIGFDEFICYYPSLDPSQLKSFETIATEIIPEYR